MPVLFYQDVKAAAGHGLVNHNTQPPAQLVFSRAFLRDTFNLHVVDRLEMINVDGNSMFPTLQPGDLVFISPVQNEHGIREGGVYAVEYHGDLYVKRLQRHPKTGKVRLISDNKDFEPIEIEGDDLENLRIVGRVLIKSRIAAVE